MFSGIIEEMATVTDVRQEQGNVHFTLTCPFVEELGIDQSVAHDGVCLTVVAIVDNTYTVTAMRETLLRSNISTWREGTQVNVERSMRLNDRLDGHIVQGHVDLTAVCTKVLEAEGSWTYTFEYMVDAVAQAKGYTTVEKGSVTVNGVSLTVCDSMDDTFSVNIIPYTYEHTNFHNIVKGSVVNIEFDIIGKYIAKMIPAQ